MQNKALLKSPLPDRLSSALICCAFPCQSSLGNIFVGWCDGFVVGKLGSPGSTLNVGFSIYCPLPVLGWDGMGWDGVSKVSFNFLYTLWVYRSCIYILIKLSAQISCGFKMLVKLGVRMQKFKNTL